MIDLDKLDKLHEAATPAPIEVEGDIVLKREADGTSYHYSDWEVAAFSMIENAKQYVALRNAYPQMAAELRRLRAENARMREALEEIANTPKPLMGQTEMRLRHVVDTARRALEVGG